MKIRVTKKVNEEGIATYYAYRKLGIIFPTWVFVTLVMEWGKEDPIALLRRKVENRMQKEVTILEYDL